MRPTVALFILFLFIRPCFANINGTWERPFCNKAFEILGLNLWKKSFYIYDDLNMAEYPVYFVDDRCEEPDPAFNPTRFSYILGTNSQSVVGAREVNYQRLSDGKEFTDLLLEQGDKIYWGRENGAAGEQLTALDPQWAIRRGPEHIRPHISKVSGKPTSGSDEYLNDAEACLNLIELGTRRFRPDYRIEIKELTISDGAISSGNASDIEIDFSGPSDRSVMCHEAFHVFQIQGWQKGFVGPERTSKGKTSPLFEAVPQLMAILGTGDCLVGRKGRKEMAYDHCQPIDWAKLPSLKETATRDRQLFQKYGLDTKQWDDILNLSDTKMLEQPSAYYSSIPLGYALFTSLSQCRKIDLIQALLQTYSELSYSKDGAFDSIKSFTPYFVKTLSAIAKKECTTQIISSCRKVGLLDESN